MGSGGGQRKERGRELDLKASQVQMAHLSTTITPSQDVYFPLLEGLFLVVPKSSHLLCYPPQRQNPLLLLMERRRCSGYTCFLQKLHEPLLIPLYKDKSYSVDRYILLFVVSSSLKASHIYAVTTY